MNPEFAMPDHNRAGRRAAFDPSVVDGMGVEIRHLVTDSRKVGPGDTFLACAGTRADARHFIADAIAAGAGSVLWERDGFDWNPDWHVPNLPVAGLADHAGLIASHVYHYPSRKLVLIGVTGTNGKTSCSHWIARTMAVLGRKTALIGTLGNGFPGLLEPAINTTPDAVSLQHMLSGYLQQEAACVVMEVSSHGISQGRINGSQFTIALLTNLSRDHLDYHGSMEEYALAKARLFDWPGLKYAVLNLEDALGVSLSAQLADGDVQVMGYGFEESVMDRQIPRHVRTVYGRHLKVGPRSLEFDVQVDAECATLRVGLTGRFNALNVLGVLSVLLASGARLVDAVQALQRITPVTGRMEQLGGNGQPLVVIDYAHTPDALEKVLMALRDSIHAVAAEDGTADVNADSRQTPQAKLICVFGCGGERDTGKRALMGGIATRLAEVTVITSDNPRSENPRAIIDDIVSGVAADSDFRIEADRERAISMAIHLAGESDVVLIAGKGHEAWQEVSGSRLPFSDRETAMKVLQDLTRAPAGK